MVGLISIVVAIVKFSGYITQLKAKVESMAADNAELHKQVNLLLDFRNSTDKLLTKFETMIVSLKEGISQQFEGLKESIEELKQEVKGGGK